MAKIAPKVEKPEPYDKKGNKLLQGNEDVTDAPQNNRDLFNMKEIGNDGQALKKIEKSAHYKKVQSQGPKPPRGRKKQRKPRQDKTPDKGLGGSPFFEITKVEESFALFGEPVEQKHHVNQNDRHKTYKCKGRHDLNNDFNDL
jgi:hypothetical protein